MLNIVLQTRLSASMEQKPTRFKIIWLFEKIPIVWLMKASNSYTQRGTIWVEFDKVCIYSYDKDPPVRYKKLLISICINYSKRIFERKEQTREKSKDYEAALYGNTSYEVPVWGCKISIWNYGKPSKNYNSNTVPSLYCTWHFMCVEMRN